MRSRSLVLLLACILATEASPFENVGRVVRGHLGTLYSLRNKLSGSGTSTAGTLSPVSPIPSPVRKESRGYSFHYSPAEVTNPIYPLPAAHFASRTGKLEEEVPKKVRTANKSWAKVAKVGKGSKENLVNSFNQHTEKGEEQSRPSTTPEDRTPSDTPTSSPTPLGPMIQSLGQGLNTAMTTILTQKLMSMLDQDVPASLFNPLKHLVASGNRMIEFWDKRASARDGKNPGIVEMLGYGLDQLKKFRDGQAIKPSDPVANLTSPAKTLIQGMLTVRKLTNRVLGYDTSNELAESRGGYGHDSYGHGGGYGQYVSYGHYLDPYAILATLGFGVFLFNVIFNLLSNNNMAASGRSLDVSDLDIPLALSDIVGRTSPEDKVFGTPMVRSRREVGGDEDDDEGGIFYSAVDKLHGIYSTYKRISERPKCGRLYMCRLAVEDAFSDETSILSPLYMFGLGQLAKDKSATQFVKGIRSRVMSGETVDCDTMVKGCREKEKRNL